MDKFIDGFMNQLGSAAAWGLVASVVLVGAWWLVRRWLAECRKAAEEAVEKLAAAIKEGGAAMNPLTPVMNGAVRVYELARGGVMYVVHWWSPPPIIDVTPLDKQDQLPPLPHKQLPPPHKRLH
jgi:hypothetical protein